MEKEYTKREKEYTKREGIPDVVTDEAFIAKFEVLIVVLKFQVFWDIMV